MSPPNHNLPAHFADLKREIAASYPNFQERVTAAWNELLQQLEGVTTEIIETGSDYIPQIDFKDLAHLDEDTIDKIKRRGTVVIRNVVDDSEALAWKTSLEDFIKANPDVDGIPENDKQFFQLYWTKSQVQARSHPNVLAVSVWLNQLYHMKAEQAAPGVDLGTPLSYADRFRIRHPGTQWDVHPPHVDGGAIERWEDKDFRRCFAEILSGNWRQHDPYELGGRLDARSSLYGPDDFSSVFRTFQGWLAMSETAPTQGTLKVFPDVLLSTAYIMLRPFFRPIVDHPEKELSPENWEFGITPPHCNPNFPGILPRDGGYTGPRPTPALHPHLRLAEAMTSVPKVNPGDTVFWHCDVVHSVEEEHTGVGDSAVLYIPAVPLTPQNQAYVARQKDSFLRGQRPPDFVQSKNEEKFVGLASTEDILSPLGKRAMGIAVDA
ncbi:DUF1479-domain-containing protein [Infundibulicybe gibba]|nr:DUF1479-domain-containing protein [Infundibulicybe gibba]